MVSYVFFLTYNCLQPQHKSFSLFYCSASHISVHLRRPKSNVFKNMCTEKGKFIMEVMIPGNKVCAVEVVITYDPIKLIKPKLIVMEG